MKMRVNLIFIDALDTDRAKRVGTQRVERTPVRMERFDP